MAKIKCYFYLDDQRDAGLLAWLEQQPNRSLAVRKALRAWMSQEQGLDAEVLRRMLREELARVAVVSGATAPSRPEPVYEDEVVTEALDHLMGTWANLGTE
jgi:hypothetical protein